MDSPKIHELVFNYILKPLLENNIIKYDNINWNVQSATAQDGEDDDVLFDETDAQFKFLITILLNQKNTKNWSWDQVKNWYENDMKWKKIFTQKHSKIEDRSDFFEKLKEEIGDEAGGVLIPLLDQGK